MVVDINRMEAGMMGDIRPNPDSHQDCESSDLSAVSL